MRVGGISVCASIIKELRSRECSALHSCLGVPTVLCRTVGFFRVFSFEQRNLYKTSMLPDDIICSKTKPNEE